MQSKGKSGQVQALDPGFIPQIVTSAIGNKPPSNFVVSYIEKCTKLKPVGKHFQEGVLSSGAPTCGHSDAYKWHSLCRKVMHDSIVLL